MNLKLRGIVMAVLLAGGGTVSAGVFTFVPNVPGADPNSTFALGVNASGTIGGSYTTGGGALTHGFIGALGGPYTTFDYSVGGFASVVTQVRALDSAGNAVGFANDGSGNFREFIRSVGGTISTLVNPATTNPLSGIAQGINASGSVVGDYLDAGARLGFVLSSGGSTLTPLSFPGTLATRARGINDAGTVVGFYQDPAGHEHGFTYSSGTYMTLDDPLGIGGTILESINNNGDIAGQYTDAAGFLHGLLYDPATLSFMTLDVPGSTNTQGWQIDDLGQVALTADSGGYIWSPNGVTVPEPSTISLVGLTLAGLAFARRRRD